MIDARRDGTCIPVITTLPGPKPRMPDWIVFARYSLPIVPPHEYCKCSTIPFS